MAFPTQFLDELRERIAVSQIVGRKVKLTKKGREYTGLCPFHHEKTPSFTVNDDKGFYHCFGCGAHGDIVRFLTDCEKMPFLEAVEHLASMAGLKMPEQNPQAQRFEVQHKTLTNIMEEACQFFQKMLFSDEGSPARTYFEKRGITRAVAEQFRLGYAPNGSQLLRYFQSKNISLDEAKKLGLIVHNKERNITHDYFHNRVMFPILDKRRRVIAFGGRLMEKGEPKYLNSPETELFHKGEQLYALPNALDTIRHKNQAILVEGYMDVIALHSAGFTNAVAPLGTAFTENQLQLLWKDCDEPVICFDGDKAGRKASFRALMRALPLLSPGKSLQFVFLPDPFDPDDMIRKKSPQAFQEAVNNAKSFFYAFWNMLLEGRTLDTPERKAKLEKDALELVAKIQNERIRAYYVNEIKKKLWALDRRKKTSLAFSSAQTLNRPNKSATEGRILIAYALCYPHIIQNFIENIATITFSEQDLQNLMEEILSVLYENPAMRAPELQQHLKDKEFHIDLPEYEMLLKSDKTDIDVVNDIKQYLNQHQIRALQEACQEKFREYTETQNPDLWRQINEIQKELNLLLSQEQPTS